MYVPGAFEACLSEILASAEADKSYGGGLCRVAMLLCQGTLGDIEPVEEYRRRLATLLY